MSTQKKLIAVVLLSAFSLGGWIYVNGKSVSTNIAYTQRVNITLSAQEAGRITHLTVREGDPITALDVLARIDDSTWVTQYRKLNEQLALEQLAQAQTTELLSSLDVQKSHLIHYMNKTRESTEQTQQRLTQLEQSKLQGIEPEKDEIRWALHTQHADVFRWQREQDALEGEIVKTRLSREQHDLRTTTIQREIEHHRTLHPRFTISSSGPGVISKIHAYPGDSVIPGQPVITVVSTADPAYLTAYFEEKHYDSLIPGTAVTITLDASTHATHKGYIASVSPLAGASVSGAYPNYSSGSFTRIGQKIPVNIAFSEPPNNLPAGLSATVKLDVHD